MPTPRALIFDIEGTTTSISFVKDTLFPYATENVKKFLESSWDNSEVQEAVEGMRKQAEQDISSKVEGAVAIPDKDASKEDLIEAVSNSLKWLISIDNKNTHMKQISGFIWKQGYEDGQIKGHVYDDVEPAFKSWKDADLKIYIYSSGSVNAQKLLMKYSLSGDLQPLINDYFDTNVGHKREVSSYKNILEKISCPPEDTVFFTDIVEEADAATEAGINVFLLSREGNSPLSSEAKEKYSVIETFKGFELATVSNKRKQTSEDEASPPNKVAKISENDISDNKKETDATVVPKATENETAMEVDGESVSETKEMEVDEVKTEETSKKSEIVTDKIDESENKDEISESVSKTEVENGLNENDKTDDVVKDKVPDAMETEKMESLETETNEKTDIKENDERTEIATTDNTDAKIKETENDVDKGIKDKTVDNSCQEKVTNTDSKSDTLTPPTSGETADVDVITGEDLVENVPIINNDDVDDEKLNALLGEEGVTLEKECEEILSKVEQVTNIDAIINKTHGASNNETVLDIESEITNGHKEAVDELVDTITNDLDEIIPDLPTTENEKTQTVQNSDVEESKEEEVKASIEKKAPEETIKETNGTTEKSDELKNGDTVTESNGKIDKEPELNGQNSDHTNGTSEKKESTEDIKVKKIATEESNSEKPEQTVDT